MSSGFRACASSNETATDDFDDYSEDYCEADETSSPGTSTSIDIDTNDGSSDNRVSHLSN